MKDPKNATITDSEWMVMRAIWTMGHATSRELIDAMNELEVQGIISINTATSRPMGQLFKALTH